jgi:hypothetical protein
MSHTSFCVAAASERAHGVLIIDSGSMAQASMAERQLRSRLYGSVFMPSIDDQSPHYELLRPTCPSCGVPMWCIQIERLPLQNKLAERLHFKCMACEAEAIIPPLN